MTWKCEVMFWTVMFIAVTGETWVELLAQAIEGLAK